jgi:hypothetical protein
VALPTTGNELASWIVDVVLQGTAAALDWTASSLPVVNAVDETELVLGTTIDQSDDVRIMLALARREAWRAAVGGTADRFRVSSDGQTVDLQQVHEHAVAMLDRAESDYGAVLTGGSPNSVSVTQITYDDDPYGDAAGSSEFE